MLYFRQRQQYVKYYLPWALKCGRVAKPLLPIFWEERFEQNIDELRRELNITPLLIPTVKT